MTSFLQPLYRAVIFPTARQMRLQAREVSRGLQTRSECRCENVLFWKQKRAIGVRSSDSYRRFSLWRSDAGHARTHQAAGLRLRRDLMARLLELGHGALAGVFRA